MAEAFFRLRLIQNRILCSKLLNICSQMQERKLPTVVFAKDTF